MTLMQENKDSWKNVESVAWIRVGALGDLLVGMAALAETHKFFPNAKVTVVGPKLWCEILSPMEFSYVESIAVIERKGVQTQVFRREGERWVAEDSAQTSTHSSVSGAGSGLVPLKSLFAKMGAVVNLNIDSYRYGFVALRAGVPIRIGSAPAAMAWLYTHVSPFFGKDPLVHERDAALMVLEYCDSRVLKFFRTVERNRFNLNDWIASSHLIHKWRSLGLAAGKKPNLERAYELTGLEKGRYVLVNPTSSRREKAWPSENFYQLLVEAQAPLRDRGMEAIVLGAPHETEWLKEVARDQFRVLQPPTIADLQDVLSASCGLVTNTSSVQFIAAMTGTPVVTLMGRARPEIWGPLGPHDQVVLGRPPAELAHNIFSQELEGYKTIPVAEVLSCLLKLPDLERIR